MERIELTVARYLWVVLQTTLFGNPRDIGSRNGRSLVLIDASLIDYSQLESAAFRLGTESNGTVGGKLLKWHVRHSHVT